MRVNIYAEEMTDRVEIIAKEIDGHTFTGLRFYLELPVTVGGPDGQHRSEGEFVYSPVSGRTAQVSGPFIHRPGDDDSAAVTFWGKRDLREVLTKALKALDAHYGDDSTGVGREIVEHETEKVHYTLQYTREQEAAFHRMLSALGCPMTDGGPLVRVMTWFGRLPEVLRAASE